MTNVQCPNGCWFGVRTGSGGTGSRGKGNYGRRATVQCFT